MRYFLRNSRAIKIACGIAVGATTIAWVYKDNPLYAAVPFTEVQQSSPFIVNNKFKPAIPWDSNWDFRDPDSLVRKSKRSTDENANEEKDKEERDKVKSKASRHLLLIRHGQYDLDPNDDKDRILTKLGREQAKLTGERLKELDLPYTKLVKSTMARARETASIIENYLSPDIPVEETDLLREGAPIPPEPPSRNWRPPAHKYFADHARIEAAFRKFFHRARPEQEETSYEVFVCHANVIRYFVCRALQVPPEAWLRISLKNGSITWITISPSGNVSLRTLGDAGFMPPDKTSRG